MNNVICLTRVNKEGALFKKWVYLDKILPMMDAKLWKEVNRAEASCSAAFKFNSYCERHLWKFGVSFMEFLCYPE